MRTFIIKNPTVFEGKYPRFAFVHLVKSMADLQALKIACRIFRKVELDTHQILTLRILPKNISISTLQLLLTS